MAVESGNLKNTPIMTIAFSLRLVAQGERIDFCRISRRNRGVTLSLERFCQGSNLRIRK
jgi:hypothetical protein